MLHNDEDHFDRQTSGFHQWMDVFSTHKLQDFTYEWMSFRPTTQTSGFYVPMRINLVLKSYDFSYRWAYFRLPHFRVDYTGFTFFDTKTRGTCYTFSHILTVRIVSMQLLELLSIFCWLIFSMNATLRIVRTVRSKRLPAFVRRMFRRDWSWHLSGCHWNRLPESPSPEFQYRQTIKRLCLSLLNHLSRLVCLIFLEEVHFRVFFMISLQSLPKYLPKDSKV